MIKYDLAALARQQGVRRRRAVLRPVAGGFAAELQYRKALRQMLEAIADEVKRELVPRFEAEAKSGIAFEEKTVGERFGSIFGALRRFVVRLEEVVEQMTGRIFQAEAARHTDRFAATVRDAIGIDLASVISTNDLRDALSIASQRNAALIKDVGDQTVNRVSRATMDALAQGKTPKQYAEQLTKEFGFSDNRAKLIARNEIGSLNSQMNRMRQEQAGVTKYVWSSSRDERTRPLHWELDGTEHDWSKPGPDAGMHPGEPIQCRCTARAVIEIGED